MLKIRFQRTGRKNDPAYKIVVTEHTSAPQAGKNVAVVGSYHPKTKHTVIDAEVVKKWLGHGAQASGTVHNLLVSKGIVEGKKVNVLSKKTPIVQEEKTEEVAEQKEEEVPVEAPSEAEKPAQEPEPVPEADTAGESAETEPAPEKTDA